ncbi:hypothetical protein P0082_03145 [Candidatus Haliotispira prima]|uniref:Uncharacterized protein n=1 Tax=Candidatus Haliotispira prima TaxID=3034016 RepID=A0ABY8MIM4_9SPIO|nr:hypothetical protein P0082_03145 [Candidatus Haliotispira prima]
MAFIVHAADETAPTYADVETNIALQSRSVTSGTHYFYTAMHHGSNQALSGNIAAAVAGDYLTAGTAYKAYLFQDKNLTSTLNFSTLALPPAADWDESKDFIDGTFPYREGIYQINAQEGTLVLMPVYWKELISQQGVHTFSPDKVFVSACVLPSLGSVCLPDGGYTAEQSFEHTTVAADTYLRFSFGIQQLTTMNKGSWTFRDGAVGRKRLVTMNIH